MKAVVILKLEPDGPNFLRAVMGIVRKHLCPQEFVQRAIPARGYTARQRRVSGAESHSYP